MLETLFSALDSSRLKRPVVFGIDVAPSLEYYVQTGQFLKYAFGKGKSNKYRHFSTIHQYNRDC
ncbi:MAG: hypothetical protein LZ170_06390 [Thaumarchaeota archaeon]|nr:hypothetical protein [Candidatus Terraquivivens yellowstonensis]